MRKLLLSLTAVVIIFASGSIVGAQEWVKLSPEKGGFEAMMPGTAKLNEQSGTGNLGAYTTYVYMTVVGTSIYLVGYADYLPTVKLDTKGELAANRDNFMKGWKEGKILTEKDITLGTYPGLEFTAEVDGGRLATSRVYVVGNRPYQTIALTMPDADQKDTAKFLDSFKLTKK